MLTFVSMLGLGARGGASGAGAVAGAGAAQLCFFPQPPCTLRRTAMSIDANVGEELVVVCMSPASAAHMPRAPPFLLEQLRPGAPGPIASRG